MQRNILPLVLVDSIPLKTHSTSSISMHVCSMETHGRSTFTGRLITAILLPSTHTLESFPTVRSTPNFQSNQLFTKTQTASSSIRPMGQDVGHPPVDSSSSQQPLSVSRARRWCAVFVLLLRLRTLAFKAVARLRNHL